MSLYICRYPYSFLTIQSKRVVIDMVFFSEHVYLCIFLSLFTGRRDLKFASACVCRYKLVLKVCCYKYAGANMSLSGCLLNDGHFVVKVTLFLYRVRGFLGCGICSSLIAYVVYCFVSEALRVCYCRRCCCVFSPTAPGDASGW